MTLDRYSRQILLKEIGTPGQKRIQDSHVLIIGAGGVGCPAALYLTQSGIGKITLIDADQVDETNLPRQILHNHLRIGMNKVDSAKLALADINPHTEIQAITAWADESLLNELVPTANLVLDCSDNSITRRLSNRCCLKHKVPLISASSVRWSVQVAFFNFSDPAFIQQFGCYECLYPETNVADIKASSVGVFSATTGISGCIAASQAIQFLVDAPTLSGKLLTVDTLHWETQVFRLKANRHCAICHS